MSEPVYKAGKEIKVYYQAAGAGTGLTIEMLVFDELQALSNFTTDITPGQSLVAMPEVGTSGRYRATFAPDVEGDWMIQIRDSATDSGKVVKHYEIGGHDVDDIGDVTGLIKTQTDLLPSDPASGVTVDASIASSETAVLAAISASEAATIAEVDQLESPAMVG